MKKIFTKNLILIICLFALIIGGTNYVWQKTATVATLTSVSHQEIPFTTTTQESVAPPSVLAEESSTKSLVSVAKPSKTNKVTSQNLSKSNSKASYDDRLAYEDDEEEAKEAAERKSVQGRWAAEFEMIKNPATGQIPKGIHLKEVAAAKKTRELQLPAELGEDGVTLRTLPTIGITSRGPNNYGGRTRAIAFDVRAPNIVLAGGVSSGIFRSTDGGATWARVTPAGEIHSVTAFAQDPRGGANSDIWYCGTGENPGNSASGTGASYLGNGVLKSTDNGLTWTPLASTRANLYAFDSEFDYVNRIIVDPAGNILVAASETIQYAKLTNNCHFKM